MKKLTSKTAAIVSGRRFGRLVVTSKSIVTLGASGYRKTVCVCRCDCGEEKAIPAGNLLAGLSSSCGCFHKEMVSRTMRTHGNTAGYSETPTYKIWKGLAKRCSNQKSVNYKNYGARGIKVCARWSKFENFLSDMGERPARLTLERKNNDGNYCPENCVWADYITQTNNSRRNRMIKFQEETLSAANWARKTGLKSYVIISRLNRGWSVERTLTEVSK